MLSMDVRRVFLKRKSISKLLKQQLIQLFPVPYYYLSTIYITELNCQTAIQQHSQISDHCHMTTYFKHADN
jgi:hypothetical protein